MALEEFDQFKWKKSQFSILRRSYKIYLSLLSIDLRRITLIYADIYENYASSNIASHSLIQCLLF